MIKTTEIAITNISISAGNYKEYDIRSYTSGGISLTNKYIVFVYPCSSSSFGNKVFSICGSGGSGGSVYCYYKIRIYTEAAISNGTLVFIVGYID